MHLKRYWEIEEKKLQYIITYEIMQRNTRREFSIHQGELKMKNQYKFKFI